MQCDVKVATTFSFSNDSWPVVMKRVADEYTVMKPLPEDMFPCSFTHIFAGGYAAGYYSYKWAEVSPYFLIDPFKSDFRYASDLDSF